jgi:hypothetical protein
MISCWVLVSELRPYFPMNVFLQLFHPLLENLVPLDVQCELFNTPIVILQIHSMFGNPFLDEYNLIAV